MSDVIHQSVVLPASPREVFGSYLDSEGHEAFTGAPAEIEGRPGGSFRAFDGMLQGKILLTVPHRLIVQSWRSASFKEGDPDSTLILSLSPEGDGTRVDLVHLDVPEHDHASVQKGWENHYWTPWRAHLEGG